jgi:hypothetical protein
VHQVLACEVGPRHRHGQHVGLPDELHVRLVLDAHRLDLHPLGGQHPAPLVHLGGQDAMRLGQVQA